MQTITEQVLAPEMGIAITVATGDRFRVTDHKSGQVVDIVVFNASNPREKLSLPYSRSRYHPEAGQTFYPGDKLMVGDVRRSTIYGEMMRITADTPDPKGVHGVDGRMCNRHLYEAYGQPGKNGCQEKLLPPPQPKGCCPRTSPTAWICSWIITTTAPKAGG